MSYLGKVDMNDANIKHYSLTGSTLTTVNIGWTPASEQSLRVTINGVVQQGDTFSYSGANLTLGGPLVATDTLEVVGIQSVGGIITPADNSVTTTKLADDAVTPAKMSNSVFLAHRNIVQNGAMQICQRATPLTGQTGANPYTTCDRWRWSLATLGTWTSAQENLTTGNAFADGFRKAFRVDCTTADASPAAGDVFVFQQRIEGYNAQGLKKGTANAESTTISFWVKSNTTGTYSFGLFDTDNDRNIWQLYTISVADTWEKKTITFAGDTTGGTLNNDNNSGLEMWWYLGAGSNYTTGTLQTSWGANTWANNAVGTTQLAASTANDWAITGVQLEIGDTATPFEHKTFAQELQDCKRYFQIPYNWWAHSDGGTATAWKFFHTFPVEMRAAPTLAASGSMLSNQMNNNANGPTLVTVPGTANKTGFQLSYTTVATGTGAAAALNYPYQGYGGWSADAEL